MVERFGHKKPFGLHMIKKHLNFTQEVYRFGAMGLQTAATGQINLQRTQLGGTPPAAGSYEIMPVYLLELSPRPQGTQTPVQNVFYYLQRNYGGLNVQPVYTWVATTAQNATGSAAQSYQIEKEATFMANFTSAPGQPTSTPVAESVSRDVLEWVDFRMRAIGPTVQPCKWKVQLIQFKDLHFMPDWGANNTFAEYGNDENLQSQRNHYYDELVLHLTLNRTNMFLKGFDQKVGMHVLKNISFATMPKDSTDEYTTGECRDVKFFAPLQRLQKYNWNPAQQKVFGATVSGTQPNNPNTFINDLGENSSIVVSNSTTVAPKARLYILIMAESWYPNTTIVGQSPSFDFLLRKKHSALLI